MNRISDYIANFYKERIQTHSPPVEENILEYILSENAAAAAAADDDDEKMRDETDIEAFYEEAVRVPTPPICLPPTPRTPTTAAVATFKINSNNHCARVFHNKYELMKYIQTQISVVDGYTTFVMKINNITVETKFRGGIWSVVNYVYNYHTILVDAAPAAFIARNGGF